MDRLITLLIVIGIAFWTYDNVTFEKNVKNTKEAFNDNIEKAIEKIKG